MLRGIQHKWCPWNTVMHRECVSSCQAIRSRCEGAIPFMTKQVMAAYCHAPMPATHKAVSHTTTAL